MFALLLLPPTANTDVVAPLLAQQLGGTAYDHRAPLLRGLPLLVGWHEDAAVVLARAAALRQAGLTAWAVAREVLERTPDVQSVRAVAWDDAGLTCGFREGPAVTVAWTDIGLALPCRADSAQETLTSTTKQTTNYAAMAVGLPMSSKKTTTERSVETGSRFYCVLWLPARSELWRIDAEGVDWRGLGAAMQHGSLGNFQALLEVLRHRASAAWDPRLERAGSRVASTTLPPQSSRDKLGSKTTVATRTRSWDSDSGVMQAVRLLVLARLLQARDAAAGR